MSSGLCPLQFREPLPVPNAHIISLNIQIKAWPFFCEEMVLQGVFEDEHGKRNHDALTKTQEAKPRRAGAEQHTGVPRSLENALPHRTTLGA